MRGARPQLLLLLLVCCFGCYDCVCLCQCVEEMEGNPPIKLTKISRKAPCCDRANPGENPKNAQVLLPSGLAR